MASCTSPIVKRIERNPEIYNALSARHKDLVLQGRIEEGMTKKAVFLAWGKPDLSSEGSRNGKAYEKWSYIDYAPTCSTGFGYGTHVGGFYGRGCYGSNDPFLYDPFFYDPVTYVPYEARWAEFNNGIVFAWWTSR
jgi:hypothetical protein